MAISATKSTNPAADSPSNLSLKFHEIRPIASIALITLTLFAVVILKMEERRMGYEMLKLTKDHHRLIEEKRNKGMHLAKVTRPQLVEKLAQSRMTLKRVQSNQIIHLTGDSYSLEKTANSSSEELN